jgi:adenylate cyclase
LETRLHGINHGTNAGRACWIVAGTYCKGQVQGTFAQKHGNCRQCDFYRQVREEDPQSFELTETLMRYVADSEAEEKNRYYQVLRNLVDPAVLQQAVGDLDRLMRGEKRPITAFFSDIAGFSALSEELEETALAEFLKEYLGRMTGILKASRGTLDKYIGDALVGMFGAPVALPNQAAAAAEAALRMQAAITPLVQGWRALGRYGKRAWDLRIRIGLSSGPATVGFMGTPEQAAYTMIGATVNLAKWLEKACKFYGVGILVCDATRPALEPALVLRAVDRIKLKGMGSQDVVMVHELLGEKGKVPARTLAGIAYYEDGLRAYDDGRWLRAEKLFLISRTKWPEQGLLVDRMILRCVNNRLAADPADVDPYPVGGKEPLGAWVVPA